MPPRASPNKGTPWVEQQQRTLYIPNQQGEVEQTIRVGSPPWYAWLATATNIYVRHAGGNFFCRKERRSRGGRYWLAYRRQAGKLYKHYLGKDADLDMAKFDEAARRLTERQYRTSHQSPSSDQVN